MPAPALAVPARIEPFAPCEGAEGSGLVLAIAPIAVAAVEAAALFGVSRATWFKWDRAGRIPMPIIRSGRLVLWSVAELQAWVAADCPSRERWILLRKRGYNFPGEGREVES